MHKILYLLPHQGGGLLSDNVQDAIEEVNSNKVSKSGDIMGGNLNIWPNNILGAISLGKGSNAQEYGVVQMYDDSSHYVNLMPSSHMKSNNTIYLPDKSGTIAMTSDLDIQPLTFSAPAFSDTSKIKVTRTGKVIKVSFSGCTLNTAIGQYNMLLSDIPVNTTGYSVGVFFDQNDNDKQVSFYINDGANFVQTNNALPAGAKIWGSFIYFG